MSKKPETETLEVYGGAVTATGGNYGAGIGGGEDRDGGTIRIYGALRVIATGGGILPEP